MDGVRFMPGVCAPDGPVCAPAPLIEVPEGVCGRSEAADCAEAMGAKTEVVVSDEASREAMSLSYRRAKREELFMLRVWQVGSGEGCDRGPSGRFYFGPSRSRPKGTRED